MTEETQGEIAKAKSKTEYEQVTMTDGRTVQFAGKRKIDKTVTVAGDSVSVQFDFRNGETRTITSSSLSPTIQLAALGHGLSQKIGDQAAGTEKVEDIILAIDDMIERLAGGEWTAAREGGGDSFSGASVVIRAVCEATGKDLAFVKAFLNKKLEGAKERGEKLSRKDLYDSFRKPGTPTAAIIERLEREALAKTSKVDASDLLAEIG